MKQDTKKIIKNLRDQGDAFLEKKDFPQAFNQYREILNYDENNFVVYLKMGMCLKEFANYNLALNCFEKTLELNPSYIDAHRLIGDIYRLDLNEPLKAIEAYEKFVKSAQPSKVLGHIYNMLGNLYETTNPYENIDLQIEYFEKSHKLLPDFDCAVQNLAVVYFRAGMYEESKKYFHKLFEIGAKTDDYLHYAALRIQLKDFKEGWEYYERRFAEGVNIINYPETGKPRWQGENISDKILLVHHEQGYGDSIMFFRYLYQLRSLAKKVIFRAQNNLVDLFKTNIEGIEIVSDAVPLKDLEFDCHVPIMSLIHCLNSEFKDIPLSQGYLKADEDKVKKYRDEFFDNNCLKIGISWSGAQMGNRTRDIPLKFFSPLKDVKNSKIYSFQKGFGSEQLKNLPADFEVIDLGKTFNDFSDTAAAMQNLDIFITSDNALLNLSGAIGKKTFLLLNKSSEWRWFLEEEVNPWYDSVRIFKKADDSKNWGPLIMKVVENI